MTMMSQKDKPTYYNIVGSQSGTVIATAPKSKVIQVHSKLQKQYGEKLEMVLVTEED